MHVQVYCVRVRVDSDRVLGMLLEKAQFDVARSYAAIVGSTANEVTVKEVSLILIYTDLHLKEKSSSGKT